MEQTLYSPIIRLKQLIALIGISKSAIYDRINPASPRYDAAFPKPLKLGERSVGFVEAEIQDWLQARMADRPK
ncbi:MAG: AlpA family phage regulatory protein [Sulfuriferula sp.]